MIGRIYYSIGQGGTAEAAYETTYRLYRNDLGHYFRLLFNIVDFVDKWENEEKYFYLKTLRALLSEAELSIISLNCIYGEGREKFKPLIEKYALLNNISIEARQRLGLESQYLKSAFERQSSPN
jgi:hypothetical protein